MHTNIGIFYRWSFDTAIAILAAILAVWFAPAQAAPKIDHWTLDNGTRIYFVETHELPLVQMRAVFDAGSARDPEGKFGLAAMTGAMLNEGAGGLDADAIANRFEDVGAEFGAGVERDMATMDLRSLTDRQRLEPALEVYAKLLTEQAFPAEGFERERARTLVGLARDEQTPGAIAEKTFMRELYGAHPYGHSSTGEPAGVKALVRDDLAAFFRRYYVGANALFVIVGDVSPSEARRIALQTVGRLSKGTPASPLSVPATLDRARSKEIVFPATQSHIRVGQPGMDRLDPDYFPLYVGNYILGGGGLVSRLSEQVRERQGYSYNVYSYFYPMRAQGPFVLGLQTKNESRAPALKLVRDVLGKFVVEGPTDQEMEAAKKHLTGSFPLRIDSNRKIADNLAAIAFYGLPLTYLDEYIGRIEAVTTAQVRDAFRRRVRPENMLTVVVGGGN
jgi:zinc protease